MITVSSPKSYGSFLAARPLPPPEAGLPPVLRPSARLGILDVTKFFGPSTGGIRTYLMEKSGYIEDRPHLRHAVIVPGAADRVEEHEGVRWYQLKGRPIPTQHPYRFLLRKKAIARIVRHESPDVIEIGSPYAVPWMCRAVARECSVPLVLFYHTNFPRIICPRPGQGAWPRRLLARGAEVYLSRLARVFDGALAASASAALELEKAGFRNIERVPLGVDLALFHPGRQRRAADTRAHYGLPGGPIVMYVGRLAREKELHLVLDAWPAVEQRTGASLVMVGDGPSRQHFIARSRGRQIFWLPYERDRERLADLVAAADIMVAPGPAETFGLAALEALASGIPVVAADRGAVAELVRGSGAGVVNPLPHAESMSRTLLDLLDQDRAELGRRARAFAESRHGWTNVFDEITEAYGRLLRACR